MTLIVNTITTVVQISEAVMARSISGLPFLDVGPHPSAPVPARHPGTAPRPYGLTRSPSEGEPHKAVGCAPMAPGPRGRRLLEKVDEERSLGRNGREQEMRKLWEVGGFIAAAVLIVFGTASIVISMNGRSTVRDSLKLEQIVGTPDMTK